MATPWPHGRSGPVRRPRPCALAATLVVVLLAVGGAASVAGAAPEPAASAARARHLGCGAVADETGSGWPAVVAVDALRLRSGPGLDCAILELLWQGTPVTVLGEAVWVDGLAWVAVATNLGTGYVWLDGLGVGWAAGNPSTIPVLMYHRINESGEEFAVYPWELDNQLAWLAANGYVSVTPSDLIAYLDHGAPLPAKPVLLTIDDGFLSSLIFRDMLATHGFRGTYVLPNEAAWRLTDDDIRSLAASGEVCGHTVDHADLSALTPDQQWWQVATNKAWLEGIIGRAVTCFAYPYGSYDWATTDIVAGAGYAVAFDAWGGAAPLDGSLDRFHVQRIHVPSWYELVDVVAAIEH